MTRPPEFGTCEQRLRSTFSRGTRLPWPMSSVKPLIHRSSHPAWILPCGEQVFVLFKAFQNVTAVLFCRLWDLAAGKTMITLTHHKKSVRALTIHPTEYSFASASAGGNNIKKWKCPEGTFVFNFTGHSAIINTLSVNEDGVMFSGGEILSMLCVVQTLMWQMLQVIMVPSICGIGIAELFSKPWKTFHNLVLWKPKLVFFVPRSTCQGVG